MSHPSLVELQVVPCSIYRKPGDRLEDIFCPMSPEDADAPKPMQVTKGAFLPTCQSLSVAM